ncbi:hypothetical protein AAZV13_16G009000 [Glycine max]|uniref:uncharacterized protein n=1 Tax=Glycine max TaxID=3847 RepID=UPI001B355930|nr:uncharacterized protein LOC106796540 [Glycine max]
MFSSFSTPSKFLSLLPQRLPLSKCLPLPCFRFSSFFPIILDHFSIILRPLFFFLCEHYRTGSLAVFSVACPKGTLFLKTQGVCIMELDLNEEPSEPTHASPYEFDSLLEELESAHEHVQDRIRRLEAITSRARQYHWKFL